MARERFPSDEARIRTKPFVRVHYSVANHRKTAEAWADLEMRGMLVELWRIAGEKFANRTGDEVILSRSDLRSIATRAQDAHNLRALRALCVRVGYTVREQGALTIVLIRNFAKKNGVSPQTPRTPDLTPAESAPSVAVAVSSPPKTPEKRARCGVKRAESAEPEPISLEAVRALPDAFLADLAEARLDLPEKLRAPGAIRAWLVQVAPAMRDRGKRDLRKTARNWWRRADSAEVIEALDRQAKIALRSQPSYAQARASPAADPAVVAAVLSMTTRLERKPA